MFSDFRGGVGVYGASKALHLLQPELFVMWDSQIRRGYGVDDYLEFLERMQELGLEVLRSFADERGVSLEEAEQMLSELCTGYSLAKLLDEYNYVRFSSEELSGKQREKVEKVVELIDRLVEEALRVARSNWARRGGWSGLIESSARKLQRIVHSYAEVGDLGGIVRYIENAMGDPTGIKVSEILRAAGARTLESIYPEIMKVVGDC